MFNFLKAPVQKSIDRQEINRDSSAGMVSSVQPDKLEFKYWTKATNFDVSDGDWELRKGLDVLTTLLTSGSPTVYYSLGIMKSEDGNKLVLAREDAANAGKTEIIEINRTNGTETSLVANITGQGTGCFASQNNYLHYTNNENTVKLYEATAGASTVALPVGGTKAKLCTSDGTRVIVSTDEGLVRGSDAKSFGPITTFAPSGTDLGRAFIATSDIVDVRALKSTGGYFLIGGPESCEIHACPNFRNDQVTTFPSDFPTLKFPFPGIGVEGNASVVESADGFFLKSQSDSYLRFLSITGKNVPFADATGRMNELVFTGCSLAYDYKKKRVYIQAKEKYSLNPVIMVFDITREVFWEYSGMFPVVWASDASNTYFVDRLNRVMDAFGEDSVSDAGFDIDFSLESADSFGSSNEFYKIANRAYLDAEYFGTMNLNYKLMDQILPSGGGGTEIFTKTFNLQLNSTPMKNSPQYFGLGTFGLSGFNFEQERKGQLYEVSGSLINKQFFRVRVIISGSTKQKLRIRGAGIFYEMTNQKVNTIINS